MSVQGAMAPQFEDEWSVESTYRPRILIIGAGSRGFRYAQAISDSGLGFVAAVAEPVETKRRIMGERYIWKSTGQAAPGQEYTDWRDYFAETHGQGKSAKASKPRIDSIFVCVLDEEHVNVVTAFAPYGYHVMCEKPLATTLKDCLRIYAALQPGGRPAAHIFGIGHVLRYSPHNVMLRELVLEQEVVGDVLSVEHTEPVGWWHFSHSYVRCDDQIGPLAFVADQPFRGNWRKESTTAPSLLTKSCHDIDWLLWMLCSPPRRASHAPHLPSFLSSTGALTQFRKLRKPTAAGTATNCLSCPIEKSCIYSAPSIYKKQLAEGEIEWPLNVINPEIEACFETKGTQAAENMLMESLKVDYADDLPITERNSKAWFGRCVWESDNDVCDDQFVTITWEDQVDDSDPARVMNGKTANFHMIAGTEKQCERRGRIYGDKGEIEYDGTTIRVYDFGSGTAVVHRPRREKGGHGGGDRGLVCQFLKAVIAVESKRCSVDEAQAEYLGCSLEECIRSHAMVFAAEEARRDKKVVDWKTWWASQLEAATVPAVDTHSSVKRARCN